MKYISKAIFALVFFFLCISAATQLKNYTIANAHSHNDYLSPTPFYLAFKNGFGSIEADVFPVDGILYVAHEKKQIQSHQTLQNLYLNPLLHEFASGRMRKLSLLIDIKENYKISLPLLINELKQLNQYLSVPAKPNSLTIIISGNRPAPEDYKNYPDYILFDSDPKSQHTVKEWDRVALVSLSFSRISGWKGKDNLKRKDRKALRNIIHSVHAAGKPIRFWGAPDTEISWKWQMKLRADLIGTDKIDELANFLKNKNNN
jgi:alkaline phosphatase